MDEKRENEISFVDVVATIIRHRIWVYFFAGFGIVLAAMIVFVLPLVGINLAGTRGLTLQLVVRTVSVPDDARESVNFDVADLFQGYSHNLGLVGSAYRQTLMTEGDAKLSPAAFNGLLKRLSTKSLSISSDPNGSSVTMILKTDEQNIEKGASFLSLLTQNIRASVRDYTLPVIQTVIANLSSGQKASGQGLSQTLNQYETRIRALQGILADPDFPLTAIGTVEPVEEEPAVSKGLLSFIIIAGFLILGICVAFVVEAIRRTRQDQTKLELLRMAWQRK